MTEQIPAPPDPKWRRLPQERPQQILEAALSVFSEHGIAAAKLEEIAARAGVSKGTIYLYFQSKEELFKEVVRQTVVPLIARGDDVLARGTPTEQLENYLAHQWRSFERVQSEGWIRLVLLELHKYPDLAEFHRTEVVERSNRVLGDIVRRGVESGEFRAVEPEAAVSMIKALILMHVLWTGKHASTSRLGNKPREQVLREIIDFALHALRVPGTDTPARGSGAPTT